MKTEREELLEDALSMVLPMAKGYAHEHPFGGNREKCVHAERVLSDEGAGGEPDHSKDFEGSDPRGMGPLPGEPGNPNPSFEQMENDTPPQRRDALYSFNLILGGCFQESDEENVRRALSDHEALKQAYGAAMMELKRLGATSVPLSEPAVPEAVARIAREALSCCGCSPAERDSGHKIGCPVPQLQDELDRALALRGKQGNG